jgi:hypothetical protein
MVNLRAICAHKYDSVQVSRRLTCVPYVHINMTVCASKQVVNLRAICAQKYDSVHAHNTRALHVLRALQYSHFPPCNSHAHTFCVQRPRPFLSCKAIMLD